MKIYSFDEIKAAGDCVDYLVRELHVPTAGARGPDGWQRFAYPPWRPDSDSGGFSACAKGWKDHAKGDTGTILDLAARARFGGDIFAASEHLGEWLRLTPRETAKTPRRFVCAYDYRDLAGVLIHQTVRWEPKAFAQRRPDPFADTGWTWSLDGIEPILYRLADWHALTWVCIVGGEKDADNLHAIGIPATTNPMGEGNWRASYNEVFRGKEVVLIPDNDETGRRHVATVAAALAGVAASVRVLPMPGVPTKGDASDWIAQAPGEGAVWAAQRQEEFMALIEATAATVPAPTPAATPPGPATQTKPPALPTTDAEVKAAAKLANQTPLANYRYEGRETQTGTKQDRVPVLIADIVADISRRFLGFPRRVGETLFDHDRRTGEIRFLENTQELAAWVQEKSGHSVQWSKIEGAVSMEQTFCSVRANSRRYEAISGVPNWPSREDVYYTHADLPEPTPDAQYLHEFCSFFCPSTPADATLIRAFVASPVYYKFKVDRPLWIIDASTGQGSGKSKLA